MRGAGPGGAAAERPTVESFQPLGSRARRDLAGTPPLRPITVGYCLRFFGVLVDPWRPTGSWIHAPARDMRDISLTFKTLPVSWHDAAALQREPGAAQGV